MLSDHPPFMGQKLRLFASALLDSWLLAVCLLASGAPQAIALDWPMLGRDFTRNPVSPELNAPIDWDIDSGRNVKWTVKLGSYAFPDPVVANGFVWVGTNKEQIRDPSATGAVLMCLRETDGTFVFQHTSDPLPGTLFRVGVLGFACSPLVEGNRIYFTTTRGEAVCYDISALQPGGGEPRQLWREDLMASFDVHPRMPYMADGKTCSVASYRDLLFVNTGHGAVMGWSNQNGYMHELSSPYAPSLICFNKVTGRVVWADHSPGTNILFGQWGSPLVAEINGEAQVIMPQGDGWVRGFNALTGKLLWKFDINRKNSKFPDTWNSFLNSPVLYENRIYIAGGLDLESGEAPGRLVCIDPAKEGDLSLETVDASHGPQPNANHGAIWHTDKIGRVRNNVAIQDGLLAVAEFSGFLSCRDARTGKEFWQHDLRSRCYASPLIVDRKIYAATDDGDVFIFQLSKEKRLLARHSFPAPVFASPIYANGTLYITTTEQIYAIHNQSQDWPQWRGPDRLNASAETGLLKEWPAGGPPLVWRANGIGTGIASLCVAGGRLFTMGYSEEREFLLALDAATGEQLWASEIGNSVRESSLMRWLTQRTPAADQGRLFLLSGEGTLLCVSAAEGKILWRRSYPGNFLSPPRMWGYSDWPMVDGQRLICSPGSPGATVAALDKDSGDTLWQTVIPGESAGYAPPSISQAGGVRQYIFSLSKSLVGVRASDGELLWKYVRPQGRIAASYAPLVKDDLVFLPNGYNGGMGLIRLKRSGKAFEVEKQYHTDFNFNPFQDSTALVGNHVYAFEAGAAACIELTSGAVLWREPAEKVRSAMTWADGRLVIRRASGTVSLLEVSPANYQDRGSFRIPDLEEAQGVTAPVISAGRLYLRDNQKLLCYDISSSARRTETRAPATLTVQLPSPAQPPPAGPAIRTGRDRVPDAIFVPTPHDIVSLMLTTSGLKPGELLYDLGSGDGRIVTAAAQDHQARAVGYEIDPDLVEVARQKIAEHPSLQEIARIEHEDIFTVDLSEADVIAAYLPAPLLERLLPQFEKLKPGSRIISHQFAIPGIIPDERSSPMSNEDGDRHRLFLYTIPLRRNPSPD